MSRSHLVSISLAIVLALSGCGKSEKKAADVADATPPQKVKSLGDSVPTDVPLGLPPPPVPNGPPPTDKLVHLGRRLFYEGNIAADGITSCGSCHTYDHAFAETRQVALGFSSTRGDRNTPSLLNVAYWTSLNWDGSVQ